MPPWSPVTPSMALLSRAPGFDWSLWDPEALAKVTLPHQAEAMQELARPLLQDHSFPEWHSWVPSMPRPKRDELQTFIKQALVTTCFGSTMSTRGSFMATSRIQVMSKP